MDAVPVEPGAGLAGGRSFNIPPALALKGCNCPFQRLIDGKFGKNSYRFTNFPLCFKVSFHS
jgi:hypothetical protein